MYARNRRAGTAPANREPAYKRHTTPEFLPPNYGGSAFEPDRDEDENTEEKTVGCPPSPACGDPSDRIPPSKLKGDDLLLIGLIALMVAGDADEDVVVMLAFLLMCTLGS